MRQKRVPQTPMYKNCPHNLSGYMAQLYRVFVVLVISSCFSGIQYNDFERRSPFMQQVIRSLSPLTFAGGQYMEGTPQYEYFINLGKSKLGDQIKYHPDLVNVFFPELLMINKDIYRDEIPKTTSTVFGAGQDYVINVIFDPCRGHEPNCCDGLYGTPEYIKLENTTSQLSLDRFGNPFGDERSRLGDRILILDDICTGKERPFRVEDECLGCLDPPYAGYEKGSTVLPLALCPDAVKKHCAINSGVYSRNIIDVDLIDRDTFPDAPTDMYTSQLNGQRRDFQILCRVMSTRCRYDRNRVCKTDPLGKPEGCRYCAKCDYNQESGKWDLNCRQANPQTDPPTDDWITSILNGVLTGPQGNTVSQQTANQLKDCTENEMCGPANEGYKCVDASMIPTSANLRNDGQGCAQMTIIEKENMCKGDAILDEKGRDTGLWTGLDPPCITTCRKIDIWRRDCVRQRVSLVQEQLRPRCWDYNETVPADQSCLDVDGTKLPYCVQVAISIDAMVHQCSGFQNAGPFFYDWHCGTYLEVHLPNITARDAEGKIYQRYSDEEIYKVIIEVKVPQGIHPGYKTLTMPTQYMDPDNRNPDGTMPKLNKLLCAGQYQIWWVQRTLYDFVIEFRSSFQVSTPSCDWDPDSKRYNPYKDLDLV